MQEVDPPTLLPNEVTGPKAARQGREVAKAKSLSAAVIIAEVALISIQVVALDLLLFRNGSPNAWACCLLLVMVTLAIAKFRVARLSASMTFAALIIAVSLRLFWAGEALQISVGVFLLGCFAIATSGGSPVLPEALSFLPGMIAGSLERLARYCANGQSVAASVSRPLGGLTAIAFPLVITMAFSLIFLLANPNLFTQVSLNFQSLGNVAFRFLVRLSMPQVFFWFGAAILLLGGLHPRLFRVMQEAKVEVHRHQQRLVPWFRSHTNTLVSLIVLFIGYLLFEFATLWFRELPENFYYAGYAHQGAAWLTVALAFSTLLLSYFFRKSTLHDPRVNSLKGLALGWSVLNLLLTAAVYNRMLIYIDYNGLTEMRVIGLLGISAVAIGFVLVVCKVWWDHDFRWLVHRQLWAPAMAVILFAVLPVDWIVGRYNVSRTLSGDLQPAVQVVAKQYDASGAIPLVELIDHENPIIRSGSRALLSQWAMRLGIAEGEFLTNYPAWESPLGHRSPWPGQDRPQERVSQTSRKLAPDTSAAGWLSTEVTRRLNTPIAERVLAKRLQRRRATLQPYLDSAELRNRSINNFFQYAYQWY